MLRLARLQGGELLHQGQPRRGQRSPEVPGPHARRAARAERGVLCHRRSGAQVRRPLRRLRRDHAQLDPLQHQLVRLEAELRVEHPCRLQPRPVQRDVQLCHPQAERGLRRVARQLHVRRRGSRCDDQDPSGHRLGTDVQRDVVPGERRRHVHEPAQRVLHVPGDDERGDRFSRPRHHG